jgi:transposase-like protein
VKKTNTQKQPHSQRGLKELLEAQGVDAEKMSVLSLVRLGSETLLRAAIIDEISEHLGRGRYERVIDPKVKGAYRNGNRLTTIDTPVGQVQYQRPRLDGAPNFKSQFHAPYMRRPEEFAAQVAEMYVNGVSTRKVKSTLEKATGKKIRMSRSAVSRITEKLREEFQVWKKKSLKDLKIAYLFLDAIRLGMRVGGKSKDAVLLAYGVHDDGHYELLSIGLGNSESDKAWGGFVADMKKRGLADPLLACSDGNSSLIKAIEAHLPTSWRQRCVKHRTENILEKVPKEKQGEVRRALNRVFYGAASIAQARAFVDQFRRDYGKVYPAALEIFNEDLDQCLTFYLFPHNHWRRIRTSNSLERLNREIRRRLDVIGRHPDELGCLALVFQVTRRYAKDQKINSFRVSELVTKQWEKLRSDKEAMAREILDLFGEAA